MYLNLSSPPPPPYRYTNFVLLELIYSLIEYFILLLQALLQLKLNGYEDYVNNDIYSLRNHSVLVEQ